MLAMLMQLGRHPWGFFGIAGFGGLIVALIVFVVVAVILWKIFEILAAKLGLDASWMQIIRLLIILLIFIWFMNIVFGFFG